MLTKFILRKNVDIREFFHNKHVPEVSKVFHASNVVVEFNNIVKIKETLYSTGSSIQRDNIHYVLISPLEFVEDPDTEVESEITCPYCKYQHRDSWEASDSEDDKVCGNCGSIFSYDRDVSVEYHSEPVKRNEDVKEC